MNKKVQDQRFERAAAIKSSGGHPGNLILRRIYLISEAGVAGKSGAWLTPGLHVDTYRPMQDRN